MMTFQYFSKVDKKYLLLLVICLTSLFIRLWLLDKRWINPDEGAHMMDAVLVLDGKIPLVDFGSRQPLYTYVIAGFLKLFGIHYISGRLQAVTFSLLTGSMIFLMAKALFDVKVALLSSTLYWMLPLELNNSAIVKTEPLVMFLTCMSLYAVIQFSQHSQKLWLVVAGICAIMGFYVRQSALIIPFTVLGFLALFHRGQIREVAKHFGLFLIVYIAIDLSVLGYYSRFMSLGDLLVSGVNPFGFLVRSGKKLSSLLGLSLGSTRVLTPQISDVSWDQYYNSLFDAFHLHSFLLIGLGFSIVTLARSLFIDKRQKMDREHILSYAILYLWVFFLFIAYAFYFYTRGFFIDYFREFLPPLVIISSAWIYYSIPILKRKGILEKFILIGLGLSTIWFFVQSNYKNFFGIGHHASLAIALFTLFSVGAAFASLTRRFVFVMAMLTIVVLILISRQTPLLQPYLAGTVPSLGMIGMIYGITWALLREKARLPGGGYTRFMGLSIVLGAFVVSVSFSATRLDLTSDSIWSPESVEKVSAYLKDHTHNDDEVMSGAVIWELQALRRPFQMISHPLAFRDSIIFPEKLKLAATEHPPKVIILDGYTEQTYIQQIPGLRELLQTSYKLMTTVGPAHYPVEIYQLREAPDIMVNDQ